MKCLVRWLVVVGVLISPMLALAHPLDITFTTVDLSDEGITTDTRITTRQVGAVFLGREHDIELSDMEEIEGRVLQTYNENVQWRQGEARCAVEEQAIEYSRENSAQLLLNGVTIRSRYGCAVDKGEIVQLVMTLFSDSFPDQRNIVVRTGDPNQRQQVLTPSQQGLAFNLISGEVVVGEAEMAVNEGLIASFGRFVWLGVEHVAIGYDHILFMVGIYLVVRKWKQLVKVITSFTLAHSITLVVATLGWVTFPSRLVEAAIAASIVYIGVENIAKREYTHRPLITFGLGLIHGLGFSTVLREIGIPREYLILDLVGFNVGVELGQLVIVGVLLPLTWFLTKRPILNEKIVYWLSIGISIMGLVWFLQRIESVF